MNAMTDTFVPKSSAASDAPATIALVDDDRNILASVSMTLEAEGFDVRTYVDGDSALRGLSARPVDLAILDIKMPRMDGMELLTRLRRHSKMPVIFLTNCRAAARISACSAISASLLRIRMLRHIGKPLW